MHAPPIQTDLTDAVLSQADLSGADLAWADLTNPMLETEV
jgi:uncharacterized protein YjbI with pentapeptide repeats